MRLDMGTTPRNRDEEVRPLRDASPPAIPPELVTKPLLGGLPMDLLPEYYHNPDCPAWGYPGRGNIRVIGVHGLGSTTADDGTISLP